MTKLTVTEREDCEDNLLYLQTSLAEVFVSADCTVNVYKNCGRVNLTVNCPECYSDIIKVEIADKVAEIITIKYKYEFLKDKVLVGGLSSLEKEILYTSLIAADLEDDKKYSFDRIKGNTEIAVDGIYNFRLKPLKKKWLDVAGCVPGCFLNTQLKEFITYLLENKKKRVYIDGGKVYDNHYRRLKRSSLLGGENIMIIREVLLSNCGEVELFGDIPKEDEYYLKEYYTDKIFFSNGYGN